MAEVKTVMICQEANTLGVKVFQSIVDFGDPAR